MSVSRHDSKREKVMIGKRSLYNSEIQFDRTKPKALSVLDHLKTKVRRNRLSKHKSFDLSDGASIENLSESIISNNNKQIIEDSSEHNIKKPTVSFQYPLDSTMLTNLTETKPKEHKIETNHHHQTNEPVEKTLTNSIFSNENVEKALQVRTSSFPSAMNKKVNLSQSRSVKVNSSHSDIGGPTSSKRRQQRSRTMSFQIRDDDFSVIFNDLPSTEKLIIAYPCAWKKEVFMHGRIFLSTNYLSFYAHIFKWEESLRIPYKDIISLTREKSALVIPNAIKLQTKDQNEYLFASYIPREKMFVSILRIWQNALLDQPLNSDELRVSILADQQSLHESSGDSEEPTNSGSKKKRSDKSRNSKKSHREGSNGSTESSKSSIETRVSLKENSSKSVDNETITYLQKCTCETHLAKTYVDRLSNLNVNALFELLFSDSSCTPAYIAAKKGFEHNFSEWTLNPETGKRERIVTYKVVNQSILGTNVIQCREKQVLEEEKPNLIYVLSSESYNEGMKYADTFSIATRYCIYQRDADHSSLVISAEPRFVKYVNSIVKTIIEKSIHSSLDFDLNELARRLITQQGVECISKSIPKQISQPLTNVSQQQIEDGTSMKTLDLPVIKTSEPQSFLNRERSTFNLLIIFGICFLIVHIYLWYKLFAIEKALVSPDAFCLYQCRSGSSFAITFLMIYSFGVSFILVCKQ